MHIVKVSSQNRKLFFVAAFWKGRAKEFLREDAREGEGSSREFLSPSRAFRASRAPEIPFLSLSNASALFVNTTDSLFRDVIHLARFSFYS